MTPSKTQRPSDGSVAQIYSERRSSRYTTPGSGPLKRFPRSEEGWWGSTTSGKFKGGGVESPQRCEGIEVLCAGISFRKKASRQWWGVLVQPRGQRSGKKHLHIQLLGPNTCDCNLNGRMGIGRSQSTPIPPKMMAVACPQRDRPS